MVPEIYTTGEYIEKNPTWHVEDSAWKAKQIIQAINQNNLQPKTIAEVGCGAGEILKELYLAMPQDVNFVGYEISPQAFNICQEKARPRLSFKLTDINQKRESEVFDLILCVDVFEHVEDYFGFLKQIKPTAKYHLFHIPLDISVSSVLRKSPILYARHQVGHLHYFTKETALETLQDTGYKVIDYFYTAGANELSNQSVKTSIANSVRKIMYRLNRDLAVRLIGGYSLLVLTQ